MDKISIRYGEDLVLPVDAGNTAYVSADIFIGKPGEVYVLTRNTTLTDGKGVFIFSGVDTSLPLGEYNYQINVTDQDNRVTKFPSPTCDECEFPKFVVCEALDEIEVS